MQRILLILTIAMSAPGIAQEKSRNIWEQQYHDRSAVEMAAQFESPSRPVYRYRMEIVGLLDLKPGMSVAEISAGSGFLSRVVVLAGCALGCSVGPQALDGSPPHTLQKTATAVSLATAQSAESRPETGIVPFIDAHAHLNDESMQMELMRRFGAS